MSIKFDPDGFARPFTPISSGYNLSEAAGAKYGPGVVDNLLDNKAAYSVKIRRKIAFRDNLTGDSPLAEGDSQLECLKVLYDTLFEDWKFVAYAMRENIESFDRKERDTFRGLLHDILQGEEETRTKIQSLRCPSDEE